MDKFFEKNKNQIMGITLLTAIMLAIYAVIWSFTFLLPFSQSVYNSYVLQAQRWLQGHLDLGQNYSYLEIAEYKGKFFISFPPIPSVILLPFCLVFKTVPDNFIVTVISIIGAIYAYLLIYNVREDNKSAVFFALFATIGGNFLHFAVNAGVWYFAQTASFTFTMAAFYYASKKSTRCGWAPIFLLALAFGCRPLQIIYTPLILWLLWKKLRANNLTLVDAAKKYWWWIIPPLAVGVFLMVLNYLRFDNPFEFGHNYLPEFKSGIGEAQFSTGYLLPNLKNMFALPPVENGIVQFPRFNGCALWLISPIFLAFACCFVYGVKKNYKSVEVWAVIGLTIIHMIALCMHRTLGGSQFGNRYTVDMIPAILFGISVMLANQKSDLRYVFTPMLVWGAGINLVGTIGYFLGYFV